MKLKNTDLYFNKILDYCKIIGISVFENSDEDFCSFNPYGKQIHYNPNLKDSKLIASLLHEIGHYVDDLESKKKYDKKYFSGSYKMDEELYITETEHKIIVRCEKAAWKKGEIIANKLKIPLGKWFYNYKMRCLMTYVKHSKIIKK